MKKRSVLLGMVFFLTFSFVMFTYSPQTQAIYTFSLENDIHVWEPNPNAEKFFYVNVECYPAYYLGLKTINLLTENDTAIAGLHYSSLFKTIQLPNTIHGDNAKINIYFYNDGPNAMPIRTFKVKLQSINPLFVANPNKGEITVYIHNNPITYIPTWMTNIAVHLESLAFSPRDFDLALNTFASSKFHIYDGVTNNMEVNPVSSKGEYATLRFFAPKYPIDVKYYLECDAGGVTSIKLVFDDKTEYTVNPDMDFEGLSQTIAKTYPEILPYEAFCHAINEVCKYSVLEMWNYNTPLIEEEK